jgi:hypothetical protein
MNLGLNLDVNIQVEIETKLESILLLLATFTLLTATCQAT